MKLTGIREQVFLDRYSLKDEKGHPVEKTPEEMWRRVARGIAQVEEPKLRKVWEKKFYEVMQDFKLVPGGRILSGAGTGYKVTYYNCLPSDQEVLTPDGYKPIKDVQVGNQVITGKKRARKVKHIFIRETDELLYTIRPRKLGFDEVRVTGEHPILAIKKEWVNTHRSRDGLKLKQKPIYIKASELKKGDFVAVAWNQQINSLKKINLKDYLPSSFFATDGFLTKTQLKKPIKEEITIDEKFMLLAGTWLGDGCVTHRAGTNIPAGVQITFNSEQKAWAEEIAGILQEKFTIVPTVREDRWGQKLIQVRVESYPMGLFFKKFFGAYSYKKKIPQILIEQPLEFILPLIKGLFRSDGYLTQTNLGIALSNKILAVQLHQLILRTGRFFTIFQNDAKKGKHGTFRVSGGISQANGLCDYIFGEKKVNKHHDQDYFLTHNDLFWVRIESIKTIPYRGRVYDLEVEDDHSFITGGIVVSNCFVIPSPADSRDGILETLKQMVEIMARGGGVGINLSSLRPRGARVKKVNGFSSGPCNWAELFSVATKDIIQQGGTRRGALMLMLWDWHPDVEEFITVKRDLSRINGANLSVCVSDKFMEAVAKDADWNLVFPDINDREYDTKWEGYLDEWQKMGKKVKIYKTVKARKIWDLICEAAWASAEPGVVFMERYNKWNNNWYFNKINCVNPCGEEGLPAWGVCNLCSINLSALVENGKINYKELAHIAKVGVRFQDDIIDADSYVFDQIRETQQNGERRIGLGTMGLGDALIKMKLRYGSPESLKVIDKIYKTIRDAAYESSVEIAREKGPFPKFIAKKHLRGHLVKQLPAKIKKGIKKWGIRNSVLLQQAPTGSTSLLSGVTSGIEPVYEFSFIRRDRLGEHRLYHPLFDEWRKDHPNDPIPSYFVSANDLTPEDHVRVQAAIQKYVDASISKTVNAPKTHTISDVKKLYTLAYQLGCKGVTYMREGSRPGVLERVSDLPAGKAGKKEEVVTAEVKKEEKVNGEQLPKIAPRPMVVQGATYQIETPVGAAFITINTGINNEPLEVFVNVGKAGSDVTAMAEALGRLASLVLRMQSNVSAGDRAKQIFNQLYGIGGSKSLGFGDKKVRSLPDAVAKVLAMHYGYKVKNGNGNGHLKEQPAPIGIPVTTQPPLLVEKSQSEQSEYDLCPSCGEAALAYEEGCKKCYSCGYSEC